MQLRTLGSSSVGNLDRACSSLDTRCRGSFWSGAPTTPPSTSTSRKAFTRACRRMANTRRIGGAPKGFFQRAEGVWVRAGGAGLSEKPTNLDLLHTLHRLSLISRLKRSDSTALVQIEERAEGNEQSALSVRTQTSDSCDALQSARRRSGEIVAALCHRLQNGRAVHAELLELGAQGRDLRSDAVGA